MNNVLSAEVYKISKESKRKFKTFMSSRFSIDFESFKRSKSQLRQIQANEKMLLIDYMELQHVATLNDKNIEAVSVEVVSGLRDKLQMLYVYFSEYKNVTAYNIDKLTNFYDYFEYINYITSLPSQETEKQDDPVEIATIEGANLQRKLQLFHNMLKYLQSHENNAILLESKDEETINELFNETIDNGDDIYSIINSRSKFIRVRVL